MQTGSFLPGLTNRVVTLGDIAKAAHGQLDARQCGVSEETVAELVGRLQKPSSYGPAKLWEPVCMDSRCVNDQGARHPGVALAGGPLTTLAGYLAIRGVRSGDTMVDTLAELQRAGILPLLVFHSDCGAWKLFSTLMGQLGITLPSGFTPASDAEFFQLVDKRGLQHLVEHVLHKHMEAVLGVCRKSGKSLIRAKFNGLPGHTRPFALDVWAIHKHAVRLGDGDPSKTRAAEKAMGAFNQAAVCTLAGPGLVIVPYS